MPFNSSAFFYALTDIERDALSSHLARVEFKQHQTLFDIREAISKIYFVEDAVISLVVPLSTGEKVEAAMVGRDGVVGAAAALNGQRSLNRAVVQVAGQGLVCELESFKNELTKYPHILRLVGAHEQVLLAQAQQIVACNATHSLESRLARWLLRAADLHGDDDLPLNQGYVSEMLGVCRTSVSVTAHTLQRAGMIKCTRGHIKLLDISSLQETACECYQKVKLNYDALLRSGSNQTVAAH